MGGSSPLAKINNQAVKYGLSRDFSESLILFEQAILEKKELAILYNNMGLTYELMGAYDNAFRMYAQATIIEPGNEYFRNNLLLLDK
jgi:tetratricopeptide (TPR) repeat protein